MNLIKNTCPFCKSEAECYQSKKNTRIHEVKCSICGIFVCSDAAQNLLFDGIQRYTILNCISENIKSNREATGDRIAWFLEDEIVPDNFDSKTTIKHLDYYLSIPIIQSDKPRAILIMVAHKLENREPFSIQELYRRDILSLKIQDEHELYRWLDQLKDEHCITWSKSNPGIAIYSKQINSLAANISITPNGWSKVYESRTSLKSKKVFIAMQFNWGDLNELKNDFLESIKKACRKNGYEADVVTENHTGPIMDRIISSIKESNFMIADFTFNNRGAYFEAGYARALGIPVIHTVMGGHTDDKDDDRKRLHFDIQQINYIKWEDLNELEQKISERIKAVIE